MKVRYVDFRWWRLFMTTTLMLLLVLVMVTGASANQVPEDLMWVTVCHTPVDQSESAQTMVLYWSAVDKCLSTFNDFLGPCP
jgi:hypothetical protein